MELGNFRGTDTGTPTESAPTPNAATNNDNPVEQDNINNDDTLENMPTAPLNENDIGDNKDSEDEPLAKVQNKLREDDEDNTPLSEVQKKLRAEPGTSVIMLNEQNSHLYFMAYDGNIAETGTFHVLNVIQYVKARENLTSTFSKHMVILCVTYA